MFGLHGLGWGFPGCSAVKNLPVNGGGAGDVGLIPGSGKSPEGEMAYPLQYSSLGNPTDRAASGYSPWRYKQSDTIEHTHTHTHTHTHARTHTCTHIHIHAHIHIHTCAHKHMHMHVCTHINICTHIHTCVCAHTHINTCTHTNIHTHTHTHTHTGWALQL